MTGRRKEYTLTVRQLASYVNKRDPRVKTFKEAKAAAKAAAAKLHAERMLQKKIRAAALLEEALDDAVLADADAVYDEIDRREAELDEQYGANEGGSSDDEEGGRYCVACKKAFKNVKQWHNHEKSKKHKEKVAKMRKELEKEDAKHGGAVPESAGSGSSGSTADVDGIPLDVDGAAGSNVDIDDEVLLGDNFDEEEWLRQEEVKDRARLEQGIADSLNDLVDAVEGSAQSEGEADVDEPAAAAAAAAAVENVGGEDMEACTPVEAAAGDGDGGGGKEAAAAGSGGDGSSDDDDDADAEQKGGEAAPTPAATQTKNRKKLRKQMKVLKAQLAASTNDTTEWAKFNDDASEKKCQVCKATFASRSKLFAHIEETGHAAPKVPSASGGGGSVQAAGKAKSKKARRKEEAMAAVAAAASAENPRSQANSDDDGAWEDETKKGKKKKKKKK